MARRVSLPTVTEDTFPLLEGGSVSRPIGIKQPHFLYTPLLFPVGLIFEVKTLVELC